MKKFIDNVNNSAEASSILLNWGLKLAAGSVQLPGRIINPEKLLLGKGFTFAVNSKADWGRETTSNQMLSAVDLKKWVLVYVSKNEAVAQGFVSLITKLAPKMGMKVAQPDMKSLANDRTETYLKTIRDAVNPNVQMVVAIMPTPRDDRYSAVKKLCCVEQPVPSQVINFKTISNEKKVSSVVQKVALQINCKLGGELWGCQMPAKMGNIMVLGVDVYHDPSRRGSSIAGVVSSTNMTMSRWYSSTVFQNPGQELVDCLKVAFVKGLKKFYEANHIWPDKVIVFRDGVSDSQVKTSIIKYDLLVNQLFLAFTFGCLRGGAVPRQLPAHQRQVQPGLRLHRGPEEDQHQDLPPGRQGAGQPAARNHSRPHRHQAGLLRLLSGVAACRPGHRVPHALRRHPRLPRSTRRRCPGTV